MPITEKKAPLFSSFDSGLLVMPESLNGELRDRFAGRETLRDCSANFPTLAVREALAGRAMPNCTRMETPEKAIEWARWESDWRAALRYMRADAMIAARGKPSIYAAIKWRRTTDELPDVNLTVMCSEDGGRNIFKAHRDSDGDWCSGQFVLLSTPTHWAPIPEPTKE